MYDYAIRFEEDGKTPGVAVFCRDLPQLNSYGEDRDQAIRQADDAIASTLSLYVDNRQIIPEASAALDGEVVVRASAITKAKILLWNTLMKRGLRKSVLCQVLNIAQTQGDRLVDFLHSSKMDSLEDALAAFGVHVSLSVVVDLDQAIYDYVWHEAKSGRSEFIPVLEISQAISERFQIDFSASQVATTARLTGFWQIDAHGRRHNIPPYHFQFERWSGGEEELSHIKMLDQAVKYPAEWGFKP